MDLSKMSICNQCKIKEITSPNISGELCTSCFFVNKKNRINEAPLITETILVNQKSPIGSLVDSSNLSTIIDETSIVTEEQIKFIEERLEEKYNINKEHVPSRSKETKDPTKKYCQSCLERGYGLNLATREWTPNYFLCDSCFEPLLKNTLGDSIERIEIDRAYQNNKIKVDSPFLEQFYVLFNIPEHLRFNEVDEVLNHRNDIFHYHAPSLVNMELEEIIQRHEMLQVMLFQIKVSDEPLADYINKAKARKREEANIEGINKSIKERTKVTKTKMSQDEKMAKSLGMSLEKYQEMAKAAKTTEFNKIVGK